MKAGRVADVGDSTGGGAKGVRGAGVVAGSLGEATTTGASVGGRAEALAWVGISLADGRVAARTSVATATPRPPAGESVGIGIGIGVGVGVGDDIVGLAIGAQVEGAGCDVPATGTSTATGWDMVRV